MELNNKCLLDLKIREQKGKIFQLKKDLAHKISENPIKKEEKSIDYETEFIMMLKKENQELKLMLKENEELIAEFQHMSELASKKITEVLKINECLMRENKKLKEELEKMRVNKEEMKKYNELMMQHNFAVKNGKELPNMKRDNEINKNVLISYLPLNENEIKKEYNTRNDKQLKSNICNHNINSNFVYCNSCCNFALNNRDKCFYPSSEYNVYRDTLKSFY